MEMKLTGWFGAGGLSPRAPCFEKGVLSGENAVKTGQEQGWTGGGSGGQQRDQFEGQTAGAEKVVGATGIDEGVEPAAKDGRVSLPGGSGGAVEELRGERAEQTVSIHGQGGQAAAGAFE
jgi:hypothetical protein